jgi:GPH family glycoside/pentoside/hexuronide:cation symporter
MRVASTGTLNIVREGEGATPTRRFDGENCDEVAEALALAMALALAPVAPDPPEEPQPRRKPRARFVGAFIGALIVQKFTLDLVEALGQGDAAKGWQLTMLLYGVAAALMFLATFATCRERVQPPPAQRTKLTRDLGDLAKNGPWRVMVVLGFLVIISFWVRGASAAFYFKYCVEDEGLLSWFLASGGIAALIGVALTSTLTRFASKASLYRLLMSLGGGLTIAYYWIDPHDLSLVFGLNILINLVLGPTAPLVWAMYADTADYSEWKTGRRATGLVFSAATLAQKLGGALGGAVTGWLLSYFDYVPNVPQTERTVSGIVLLVSVIPGSFGLAAAVTVTFYKLSDSLVLRIEDELRARREAGVMPA